MSHFIYIILMALDRDRRRYAERVWEILEPVEEVEAREQVVVWMLVVGFVKLRRVWRPEQKATL